MMMKKLLVAGAGARPGRLGMRGKSKHDNLQCSFSSGSYTIPGPQLSPDFGALDEMRRPQSASSFAWPRSSRISRMVVVQVWTVLSRAPRI